MKRYGLVGYPSPVNYFVQASAADVQGAADVQYKGIKGISAFYDLMRNELDAALRFSTYQDTFNSYRYGLYGSLTNGAQMGDDMFYVVTDNAGVKQASYSTEAGAIAFAEQLASTVPGKAYYVTKTITKSVVVKPTVTTRL